MAAAWFGAVTSGVRAPRYESTPLTYQSLPLGTTDATAIAVGERLELTEVASLDRHHFTVARPRHSRR
jgi:predicted nucleic acid-binding protein